MADNDSTQLTRQELYDRIRESSKDEYILEEMKRLGFWPKDEDTPSVPEDIIARQGELQRELRELASKQRMHEDPERALRSLRKERLEQSRESRAQNKRKRLEARHDKSLAWHERRRNEILYIGEGVSQTLGRKDANAGRLNATGLPEVADAGALASAMGIGLSELSFLCFARRTSEVSHYQRFQIAKKTGGVRNISAPMPRMKRAQYWVLGNILEPCPTHEAAHGFRRGRSIVSNAAPHVGKALVVNIDLKDFFPSVTYPRIKGLFRALGYSGEVSTLLALICSEPDTDEVSLDGRAWFVSRGERKLPQGAPTSPAIANLICRRLDARMTGATTQLGFAYTRYADDLSFSCPRTAAANVGKLLWRVRQIVAAEGFTVHEAKTRVMRLGARHEVTGLVVNSTTTVDRKRLRRFRALLQQLERDGPDGLHWEGREDNVVEVAHGFASFVQMVDPVKGKALTARTSALISRFGKDSSSTRGTVGARQFRSRAIEGRAPNEKWWVPAERVPPAPLMPPETASEAVEDGTAAVVSAEDSTTPARPVTFGRVLEVVLAIIFIILAFRVHPGLGAGVLAYYVFRWLFPRKS